MTKKMGPCGPLLVRFLSLDGVLLHEICNFVVRQVPATFLFLRSCPLVLSFALPSLRLFPVVLLLSVIVLFASLDSLYFHRDIPAGHAHLAHGACQALLRLERERSECSSTAVYGLIGEYVR